MNLASRTGAWAKSGGGVPTAKDYVQDGLIAMWDGIENAGWGVHDQNATVWKDLIGSDDLIMRNCQFEQDSLVSNSNGGVCAYSSITRNFGDMSLEVAFRDNIEHVNHDLLSLDTRPGTGIVVFGGQNEGSTLDWWVFGGDTNVAANTLGNTNPTSSSITLASGLCRFYRIGLEISFLTTSHNDITGFLSLFSLRNSDGRYCMIGAIYFVRLYSRALTADEIAHNYAIDKARFNLP